jgi:mannose-1-phosphate guanylyltransferase
MDNVWAVVLAGGEGTRVAALTKGETEEAVPRQYRSFDRSEPMVRWAVRRARSLVPPSRIAVVVTEAHREYWEPEVADLPPENIIVQPRNRGTAPGILLPVLEIFFRSRRTAELVFLPADHYVAAEGVLRESLFQAIRAARAEDRPVVLLGMPSEEPDTDLGWILPLPGPERVRVAAFVEKPDAETATELLRLGALASSLMLAAQASRLLELYATALPSLLNAFVPVILDGSDPKALSVLFDQIPRLDFSKDVLERCPGGLAVLSVPPCGWIDLGTPSRVERYARHCEPPPDRLPLSMPKGGSAGVFA